MIHIMQFKKRALLVAFSWALIAAITPVLVFPASANAIQESEEKATAAFTWNLKKGDRVKLRFRKKSKVVTNVKGNNRTHEQEQVVTTTWRVMEVDNQTIQFETRIDQVDVTIWAVKGRIQVSSSDDASVNSFSKSTKQLYEAIKKKLVGFPRCKTKVTFDGKKISKVGVSCPDVPETKKISPNEVESILRESWPETPRSSDASNQSQWVSTKKGKFGKLPVLSKTNFSQSTIQPTEDSPSGDLQIKFDTKVEFEAGINLTKWSKSDPKSKDVFDYNPTTDKWPTITFQKSEGQFLFSKSDGVFVSGKSESILKTSKPYSDSPILTETTTNSSVSCEVFRK